MSTIPFIGSTTGTLTAMIAGKTYVVASDHPNRTKLIQALRDNDSETFLSFVDIPKVIRESLLGHKVEIDSGEIILDGKPLHNTLTMRILEFQRSGLPFAPLAKFLERLAKNPSKWVFDEIYAFLEHKGITITEDGCFLGYKRVRDTGMDWHSNTIMNEVGKVVSIPRREVDDSHRTECSYGLHVGSSHYIQGFHTGLGKILVVKVDPADVVTVPTTEIHKLRTCKYEVISVYEGDLLASPLYSASLADGIKPVGSRIAEEDANRIISHCDECGYPVADCACDEDDDDEDDDEADDDEEECDYCGWPIDDCICDDEEDEEDEEDEDDDSGC